MFRQTLINVSSVRYDYMTGTAKQLISYLSAGMGSRDCKVCASEGRHDTASNVLGEISEKMVVPSLWSHYQLGRTRLGHSVSMKSNRRMFLAWLCMKTIAMA